MSFIEALKKYGEAMNKEHDIPDKYNINRGAARHPMLRGNKLKAHGTGIESKGRALKKKIKK